MSKLPVKKEEKSVSKEIVKPFTIERAREIVILSSLSSVDASNSLKELAEKQLPALMGKGRVVPPKEVSENIDKVFWH
ncbi:MAG: hypothetical protein WAT41_07700 [Flavobacteriales bacterium]